MAIGFVVSANIFFLTPSLPTYDVKLVIERGAFAALDQIEDHLVVEIEERLAREAFAAPLDELGQLRIDRVDLGIPPILFLTDQVLVVALVEQFFGAQPTAIFE